jgi:hypothetical protein
MLGADAGIATEPVTGGMAPGPACATAFKPLPYLPI